MNYLMRKIQLGLFVVATTMFLFGCNLFSQVEDTIDGVAPSVYDVVPEDGSSIQAGTIIDLSFKCDKRDTVRISIRDKDNVEIDYEMVSKQDGKFTRPFWVPLRAAAVEVLVDNDEGLLYTKAKWNVTGSKPFGSFDIPKSYDNAYSYRTNEAYSIVDTIINDTDLEKVRAENPLQYVREVCERFKEEAGDDEFKKAKLIHDLLAKLIPYDMVGVKQDPMPPQDYWTVISTKKGVCQGYALCFNKFCEIIGLDSLYVFGWNRTGTHAWDIVRLDGECYLLDVTWDAGTEVGGEFVEEYSTKYMFQKPEYFKFMHYPKAPEHQLLPTDSRVASREDMLALPEIKPSFFDSIVDADSNVLTKLTGKAEATDGRFTIPFKLASENLALTVRAFKGENNASYVVRYIPESDSYEAIYTFPEEGEYTARVTLLENGASSGSVVAQFKVNVTEPAAVACQKVYAPVIAISQAESILEAGTTVDFTVRTYDKDIEYMYLAYFTDEAGTKYQRSAYFTKVEGKNLYKATVEIPETLTFTSGGDGYEADIPYNVTKAKLYIRYIAEGETEAKTYGGTDYYTVVDSE